MVVVDSLGRIEFFIDCPKADAYARYLKESEKVVMPAVVVYEVCKKIRRERRRDGAAVCGPDGKDRAFPINQSMALGPPTSARTSLCPSPTHLFWLPHGPLAPS